MSEGSELVLEGADEALLLFVAATDYNLQKLNFDRSIDPAELAEMRLADAADKSWEQILTGHIQEHREEDQAM